MNSQGSIGWDTEIPDDAQEHTLLPDGSEVDFEVLRMTKTTSKNGAPMAKLTLQVESKLGTNILTEYLVLQENSLWKVAQFFCSIGQKRHGEPLVPRWDDVEGSIGKAIVSVSQYEKEGKIHQRNGIRKYLDPVPASSAKTVKSTQVDDDISFDVDKL